MGEIGSVFVIYLIKKDTKVLFLFVKYIIKGFGFWGVNSLT